MRLRNSLRDFRLVELQCKGIISVIELHRAGMERKEDVIYRIQIAMETWNNLFKEKHAKRNST